MTNPASATPHSGPGDDRSGHDAPDHDVRASGRVALNEDWAATVVGLVLLALVLTGLLPGWLVP